MLAPAVNDDVGGTGMLELEHGATAWGIRGRQRLDHQSIKPGTLEIVKPSSGDRLVVCERGEVQAIVCRLKCAFKEGAPGRERFVEHRPIVERKQVECHEMRRVTKGE